ncbi:hemerythrin domain-containing protein [Aquisalimonas lutea]|uniref:hemerythrin domain-containing protein n=1 Tax=Aquisalimonas lutea TaxID=1327750 RepID=UPI0025B3010B|nr:hemerythrin domain-containing protein [Aquisalimonas lutea]MDN3519753.1 hemerythrin domain-containing protein [Aquisalimonas lutea]
MNDQVLSRLRQDHDNLRPLLRVLDQQLECIEANGDADYVLMADILDYLVRKPEQYHHPFEERLGQRLLAREPAAADAVSRIRAQHHRLTRLGKRLQRRLDEIAADSLVSRTRFVRLAHAYVRLYETHLDDEERELFPALDNTLAAADWIEATTAFQWTLDPAFTADNAADHRDLRDRIELALKVQLPQSGTGFCPLCAP